MPGLCTSDLFPLENTQTICRICREVGSSDELLSPCSCKGTIRFVHRDCLLIWIQYRLQNRLATEKCELCGSAFKLRWKTKPLTSWSAPAITFEEKTKLNVFIFSYLLAA